MHVEHPPANATYTDSQSNVTPLFRHQVGAHRAAPVRSDPLGSKALEQRWHARLQLLLRAEVSMHRANRLRAFCYTIIVTAALLLGFSLYLAPVTAPWVLGVEAGSVLLGGVLLPVSLLLCRECRRHRDHLSRKFYESNHEVEYTDDGLVLINRSSYTAVTQVPFTDL